MSLSPGTRLGPYEIVSQLGAGGMGEVWRARDTRLGREVAIKISREQFSERFEREARAVAALNHPNICTLYDVGPDYLVMELIEGPTLAERLRQGPVALEEALPMARQIAESLDAAHEKGIVHRDLKPGNIKVKSDGTVKVLDFGLAKAMEPRESSGDLSQSPTLTLEATRAGMLLGTAAYMSPEQARGKPVDRRSDIWAFGVIFYELLSGQSAFEGETVSDTLAAVLRAEIDWSRLPADTPVKIHRLLRRCLERDPKRRLRDIGDAWIEMDAPEAAAPAPPAHMPSRTARWMPWMAAAAIAAAGVGWGLFHTPAAAPRPIVRWAYSQQSPFALVAVSRDGTRLAYTEVNGNSTHLVLRTMDQLDGKPIPGADEGVAPRFSPDGQWIAYFSGGKLMKIPVAGGTPVTICDAAQGVLSWGDDDTIVFSGAKGLLRVPAAGGAPQAIATLDQKNGEIAYRHPSFLRGAQAILFTIASAGSNRVAVLDLKRGPRRVLVSDGSDARYVPTGHLVYVRGQTLFAAPFDIRRLAVTGAETPVIEDIGSVTGNGTGDYAFSDGGLLVHMASGGGGKTILAWADRKGAIQPFSEPQFWGTGRLSPDGRRVANTINTGGSTGDIWIDDIERRTPTRLTFDGANQDPIWTPDGLHVTYSGVVSGKRGIYSIPADGSGKPELLVATEMTALPRSWTSDGKTLVYLQGDRLWMIPLSRDGGGRQPVQLHDSPFAELEGEVSPDGHWLTYVSNESGETDVYVQPFPTPGGKIRISTQGGRAPRWSRNGRELFYKSGNALMAVEVQTAPSFRAGLPQALFTMPAGTTWDVAPDGKQFLVEQLPSGGTFRMAVVVNWFDELRKKAPVTR